MAKAQGNPNGNLTVAQAEALVQQRRKEVRESYNSMRTSAEDIPAHTIRAVNENSHRGAIYTGVALLAIGLILCIPAVVLGVIVMIIGAIILVRGLRDRRDERDRVQALQKPLEDVLQNNKHIGI